MMEIVKFSTEHLAEAAVIEELCFSEPWSEQGLMLLTGENALAYAAVEQGRLAAYAGMVTVLDEGEIINVATHPDYRRRGYGRAVLRELTAAAERAGITFMTLEVRSSNEAAQALYISEGFEPVGLRKNFYTRPREDAVVMVKKA